MNIYSLWGKSLIDRLENIVAGMIQALEVVMQAWSILEDSTTINYLKETLKDALPYNTTLKWSINIPMKL